MLGDLYIKAISSGGSVPVLPSGTYTPRNSISGPFDLLWIYQSAGVITSAGVVQGVAIGGYNGCACSIPHNGDFTLQFRYASPDGYTTFGLSYSKRPIGQNQFLSQDFGIYKGGGGDAYYYEKQTLVYTIGYPGDVLYELKRNGLTLEMYVDNTLLNSTTIENSGPIYIDFCTDGAPVIDAIQVIIP